MADENSLIWLLIGRLGMTGRGTGFHGNPGNHNVPNGMNSGMNGVVMNGMPVNPTGPFNLMGQPTAVVPQSIYPPIPGNEPNRDYRGTPTQPPRSNSVSGPGPNMMGNAGNAGHMNLRTSNEHGKYHSQTQGYVTPRKKSSSSSCPDGYVPSDPEFDRASTSMSCWARRLMV